jgi:hypothetical protein
MRLAESRHLKPRMPDDAGQNYRRMISLLSNRLAPQGGYASSFDFRPELTWVLPSLRQPQSVTTAAGNGGTA